MFNTTHIHQHKTEHVPYVKKVEVTEKKAPTDESVRLLNEMQEKARENIIHSINIDTNVLKALTVFYRNDIMNPKVEYHIKFQLNDEQFLVKAEMNHNELINDASSVYKMLFEKTAIAITKEIFEKSPTIIESFNKLFGK